MTNHRDAITGQYVTADHAAANLDTTVSESPCTECERLRGIIHAQKVAIDGYREEVERLRAAEPIVRTVGDLTARHLGQEVRIPFAGGDLDIDYRLTGLRWVGGGYVECALDPDGGIEGVTAFPLDTPCEVLS